MYLGSKPDLVNHMCTHLHAQNSVLLLYSGKQTYKILAIDNSVCKLVGSILAALTCLVLFSY
jgi:hypothetical protein